MAEDKDNGTFSDFEREAMKDRAKELKAQAKATRTRQDGENEILAAINELPEPEHSMAKRLHEIVKAAAPELFPKTWYGMPAYANSEGKVICFFQPAHKFKSRYATFGFNDLANLDDGNMWPASFALVKLTDAEEKKITSLVKKAIS